MTVNEELLHNAVSHAVYLEHLKGGISAKMGLLLGELTNDLVRQIKKIVGGDPTKAAWTLAYKKAMLRAVKDITAEWNVSMQHNFEALMQPVAYYEPRYWTKLFEQTMPLKLSIAAPAPQQLWAAVMAKPFEGALMRTHMQKLEASVRQDLDRAVRLSYAEGEPIQKLVQRIRGTKAAGYRDGILPGLANRKAQALARTAVQHTAAVARDRTFEENADLIKGEQWVATLDARTTILCASRDGKIYSLGEAPPIPAHWQCRSTKVPVVKSWQELGLNIDELESGTRASLDGYQPASLKYEQWLEMQPEKIQKQVLGVRRWELWKGGKPLEEFVIDRTKTISLAELARIEDKVRLIQDIPHGIDGAEEFGSRIQRDPQAPALGGSTGAFVAVDDEGAQWIVKQYGGNQLQVQNEWIANRFYEMGGAQVPEARLANFEGPP